MTHLADQIVEEARWARTWLFDAALPFWRVRGVDSEGHVEKFTATGEPIVSPRRALVQCRQIYSFCEAGRLGWPGDWRGGVEAGLATVEAHHRLPDGPLAFSSGENADRRIDLYTQAFGLFAYGHAFEVLGRPDALKAEAQGLLDWLKAHLAHPEAGFQDRFPPVLPLRSNPHMHLFEAFLAWDEFDPAGPWRSEADALARLCRSRFVDPKTGAVREYFNADWTAAHGDAGRIVEPGHQFEWAWLLARWADRTGDSDWRELGARMLRFGLAHGIDAKRAAPVHELWIDGSVKDPMARLWPHTERLKAAIAYAAAAENETEREGHLSHALEACTALRPYLDVETPGLWRDKLDADGQWVDEPAPASSLYHIICAYSELIRAFGGPKSAGQRG